MLLTRHALVSGAIALFVVGASMTPASAARPNGELALASVSAAPVTVDASTGTGSVHLTWSFTDTTAGVNDVTGTLTLARTDGTGTFTVPFDFLYIWGSSGTIEHPAFAYDFAVPQYARTSSADYQVTKIAATDDQGGVATVTGSGLSGGTFTATEVVDVTGPTYDTLKVAAWSPNAIYNRDRSGTVTYSVDVHDEAGLDSGELVLKGPDGTTLTSHFRWDRDGGGECEPDERNPLCTVDVVIPADAAAGTWTADRLTLTDAAGNTADYSSLDTAPITVSANRQIEAADLAFDPAQVDNWHDAQVTHLRFTPSGLRQGLGAVRVDITGPCSVDDAPPVVGDDGKVDIPVAVYTIASLCTVEGLTVSDNAGDTSLYGTEFGAPDPHLTITRTPDTDPPVTDAARLSWTVPPADWIGDSVIAHTVSHVGVTQYSVTVFDSSGVGVGGGGGGVTPDASGNVTMPFSISRSLPPGAYTVGFTLVDAGRLHTAYGYPNTQPPPGGPLTITIPAG